MKTMKQLFGYTKQLLVVALVTAALVFPSFEEAFAADNALIISVGSGLTMHTKDIGGGIQQSFVGLGDATGGLIYGTAGSANANVLSVQGIASMTPLLVTLSGSNSLAANQSVNVAQVNGVTPLMGNGVTGTGSPRVTIASDNSPVAGMGIGATGSAVPANAVLHGVSVGGNTTAVVGDPCQVVAASFQPISITTATTTRIIAPASSKKTYVCAMFLYASAADNVGVVEGTGGTCGTGTQGVIGGTTAANGINLTANQGFTFGTGSSSVFATAGTNVDFCLITSSTAVVAGHVKFVQL